MAGKADAKDRKVDAAIDQWKCRLYPGDAKVARTKLLAWIRHQKCAAERKQNYGAHVDASPAKRQRTKPRAVKPKAAKPKAGRKQPKASRKHPSSAHAPAAAKRAKKAAKKAANQ